MPSYSNFVFSIFITFIACIQVFGQTFSSSNLPLVLISTNGLTIKDSPKIMADMDIIWNSDGSRNSLNDPKNNYNGKIGIEIRGSSSQQFPKKSYGIETRIDTITELNVSLLGLPEESDWILHAPYTDKTMIRDVLTYTIDSSFGHYSPRCRYVELFLNGNYEGVYVLMEKIKRDKNRVNIAKLKTSDVSGEDVTGGYIIKIDKTTGDSGEGWYSEYFNMTGRTLYQYEYPEADEITIAQKSYIQTWVRNMEQSLYSQKYKGLGNYHDYLNDTSFIDFMIINELSKNIDGYRLSSYLYKGKDEKINCGPIWDFNLGYGNTTNLQGWSTSGFQYQANLGGSYFQNPFWWEKLVLDQDYVSRLKRRWSALRKKQLSTQRFNFLTDSLTSLLSEAKTRNFQRWPIIGQYVWPNYYVGTSYEAEVHWLKNWITNRVTFLDQEWMVPVINNSSLNEQQTFSVYTNPFFDEIKILTSNDFQQNCKIELFNLSGELIFKTMMNFKAGISTIDFSKNNPIQPGIHVLKISRNDKILLKQKVVKLP